MPTIIIYNYLLLFFIIILRPKSESVENHANEGEKVDSQGGRLVPMGPATSHFHFPRRLL